MITISLAFLTLFVGVFSYYLWTWTYWKRRGIPGPMGYPIFGSSLELFDSENPPPAQLEKWTKKYGKVYGMTQGLSKTLVISNADLVQEVLVNQYDNFYGRNLNPIQGNPNQEKRVHLFAAQGHRWKRLRTISSPTFSNNSLRKLKTTVEDSCVELLRHMEEQTAGGKPIELLNFYQEFTLDVIGRIALGQTDSQIFKNPMLPYVRAVFGEPRKALFMSGFLVPWIAPILRKIMFSFPSILKNPAVHIIRQTADAVEKRIAQRVADERVGIEPGEPQDFIDLFLDAKSDDVDIQRNEEFSKTEKVTKKLTTDEVVGQCFVFLVGGFDTTALSLSFSSYLLATHPDVQKKLQEEVDRECKDPEITFDKLSKLKYMECVIKETLRLYPLAALANARRCMRPTTIGGVEIEKGVDILCDTWTIHKDPKIWGVDAEEFKPERWESGDDHILSKGSFISFGLGPRQCIGMRLAYMEEKLFTVPHFEKIHIENLQENSDSYETGWCENYSTGECVDEFGTQGG